MNKNDFFNQYKPKSVDFEMPDGNKIRLVELSLGQRGELQSLVTDDSARAQAVIVTMSCPLFTADDVDKLLGMPGDLISSIATAALGLSGLNDGDDDEKN